MTTGSVKFVAIAACLLGTLAPPTLAAVDLVLRTDPQLVPVGARLRLELYAVSDDGTDQEFSAADVGFTWDPAVLTLVDAIPGSHQWSMFGFIPDSGLDGINDSLTDGDARYTVLSFAPATADGDGFLMATFQFDAIGTSDLTEIVIESSLGQYSPTRVFGTENPNENVTGSLGVMDLTVAAEAVLSVSDVTMLAGRNAIVVASGEIVDADTFGVMLLLKLVPRDGSTGSVEFTLAPPSDISQLGDPWPSAGAYSVFDTDNATSAVFNGFIDDNGTQVPEPLTFAGEVAGFPVFASGDAVGEWDIRLTYYDAALAEPRFERSSWHGVITTMRHSVLKVVKAGDGDGSTSIDTRDFSQLQACFTGPAGPVDPPAYSQAPALPCGVYDFDGDGDIDADDYASFAAVLFGPSP